MLNFKCKRCGECCWPPRLYKQDIERIEKAGYKDFIYTDNNNFRYMKENKNGRCIFLRKKGKAICKIYKLRPKICRLYPSRLINGSCKPEKTSFDRFLENETRRRSGSY